jgi:hypothetical protein
VRLAAAFLLTVLVFAASVPSRVTRSTLVAAERAVDRNVTTFSSEDQGFLLGPARAVYLDGYGAVLTAEVDLVPSAAPNPFRPQYSKSDIANIKGKKRIRLAMLREKMREILVSTSASLENVSIDDKVALAVTIPYYTWEDSDGMPRQILMYGTRRGLAASRATPAEIKVQEF